MRLFRAVISLLFAITLTCGGGAHAQERVRLGILPFSESLGAVMADRLGYFKAEGIEVEMMRFNGAAQAVPVLFSGKLDVVFSSTVVTLLAMEQGLDATLVAPGAVVRSQAPDTTAAMLALKGLIRSPKDLEGKRIAVNVLNSSLWLYILAYLDKHGVDRSKVRFVEIPFPQMSEPLLNKQVDVVAVSEPFATVLIDTGRVDTIAYPYVEAQPNGDVTQYIALSDWVRKNASLVQRFGRAVAKGSEFVNRPENNAVVREANVSFTSLAPALKDRVQLPLMGASISVEEITKTQALMMKYGIMKKPVDVGQKVYVTR